MVFTLLILEPIIIHIWIVLHLLDGSEVSIYYSVRFRIIFEMELGRQIKVTVSGARKILAIDILSLTRHDVDLNCMKYSPGSTTRLEDTPHILHYFCIRKEKLIFKIEHMDHERATNTPTQRRYIRSKPLNPQFFFCVSTITLYHIMIYANEVYVKKRSHWWPVSTVVYWFLVYAGMRRPFKTFLLMRH